MLSSKVPKQHKSLAYALLQIPNAIPSLEEIKKPQEGNEATEAAKHLVERPGTDPQG